MLLHGIEPWTFTVITAYVISILISILISKQKKTLVLAKFVPERRNC